LVLLFVFETGSYYVAQAGLEFATLLPLPPDPGFKLGLQTFTTMPSRTPVLFLICKMQVMIFALPFSDSCGETTNENASCAIEYMKI
jgi:hypothetical protein